jgi:hypothetical protein
VLVWDGEVGGREERNEKRKKGERGRGTRCARGKIDGRYRHDIPPKPPRGERERKRGRKETYS